MYCHICGKKLPDGLSFCTGCGTKLQTDEPVVPVVPEIPAPSVEVLPAGPEAKLHQPEENAAPAAPEEKASPVQEEAARSEAGGLSDPIVTAPKAAPKKKKSPLKAILIALLCLVMLGAGVVGTLFFTGAFDKDEKDDVSLSDRNDRDEDRNTSDRDKSDRDEGGTDTGDNTAPDGGAFDNSGEGTSDTGASDTGAADSPADEGGAPAHDGGAADETPTTRPEEQSEEQPEDRPSAEPEQTTDNPFESEESAAAYFAGLLQRGDWYNLMRATDIEYFLEGWDADEQWFSANYNPNQAMVLDTPNSYLLSEYQLQSELAAGLMTFFGQFTAAEVGLDAFPETIFDEMYVSTEEAAVYAESLGTMNVRDLNFFGGAIVHVARDQKEYLLENIEPYGADDYAEVVLFVEYHGISRALGLSLVHYGHDWRIFTIGCSTCMPQAAGVEIPNDPIGARDHLMEHHGIDSVNFALPRVNLPDTSAQPYLEEFYTSSPDEAVFVMLDILMAGDTPTAMSVMDTILLTGESINQLVEREGRYNMLTCFWVDGDLSALNTYRALGQNARELLRVRDFILAPLNEVAAARFEHRQAADLTDGGYDPEGEFERYHELANAMYYSFDIPEAILFENEAAKEEYDCLNAMTASLFLQFFDQYYVLDLTLVEQTVGPRNAWFIADFGTNTTSTHLDTMNEDDAYDWFNIHVSELMAR